MNPLIADLIRYACYAGIAIGVLGIAYIIVLLGMVVAIPGAMLGGGKK